MNPQLVAARAKVEAKAAEMTAFMDKAKVNGVPDPANSELKMSGAAYAEKLRAKELELADLRTDVSNIKSVIQAEASARQELDSGEPGTTDGLHGDSAKAGGILSVKGIARKFIESDAYTLRKSNGTGTLDVSESEIKALMSTAAGWAPQAVRTGRVTMSPQRMAPAVVNYIPSVPTDQNAYVYMEETTFTNNAAEVAEGGTMGEAALATTERSAPVRKVAVWLPVTDEQLEDVAGVEAYIENRLGLMLNQRVDSQVLSGNGTSPNLRGVRNVVGIQTRAKGADSVPDALCRIMTTIESDGYASPDVAFVHPETLQSIKLLKTADGAYIWGHPSMQGPMTVFGVPMVSTTAIPNTVAVTGDFGAYSTLAIKRGIDMQISNSHDQYFVQGKQAIRMDLRLAFAVLRPKAFGTVTAVNS